MRNIINIAIHDLRVFFKDPSAVIGVILVPILFTVFFGFALGGAGAPEHVRVDVIDADQSAFSVQFLSDVRQANSTLVLCPMDNGEDDFCRLKNVPMPDEEAALKRLADNISLALIEIPQGFEAKLQAGEPVSITYRSNESAAAPSYILQAVQTVTQRMSGALVAATVGVNVVKDSGVVSFPDDAAQTTYRQKVYDSAAQIWAEKPFSVDYQASASAASNQTSTRQVGFGQSVPGMSSMFVTFFALLSSATIIREKKNWTFQRLITMPVSRSQILAGKILMYFLLGMIQYLIVFVAGKLLGLNLGNDVIALLLVMVCMTLCVTALGFALGTFLKTEEQAGAMLNLVGLTLAPLGGAWWPLDIVPPFMRTVGHISPIAWAMDAFRALLFENGTLVMILPQLGVLLALAAVFFVITIMRFKYE
jgi:linearmycin/streptolysin S transport system permease protein